MKLKVLTWATLFGLSTMPAFASENYFNYGLSSGDPLTDRVIIWTKIESNEITPLVEYEVSETEDFNNIVAKGSTKTSEERDFTVKVDVTNLKADRYYFYRFKYKDSYSEIGRTKTLPTETNSFRIAFVSCQNYGSGYFTSYKFVLEDDPDVVVMLGDSIYEYERNGVRGKNNIEYAQDLRTYRAKYKAYVQDPFIKESMKRIPTITTWDDHEVMNNYSGKDMLKTNPKRLNEAYQAFFEYTPIRETEGTRIYRDFKVGNLLDLFMLDGRQYRDKNVCETSINVDFSCNSKANSPDLTYLGKEQKEWLLQGVTKSKSTWNILGNNTVMMEFSFLGNFFNFDQWDGFYFEKNQILKEFHDNKKNNLLVFTGDFHAFVQGNVFYKGNKIADEFVVGGTTSLAPNILKNFQNEFKIVFPSIQYLNPSYRGYTLAKFTNKRVKVNFFGVSNVEKEGAEKILLKQFEIKKKEID